MNLGLLSALALLLFAWSVVSGRVERLDVTGPIVFVAAGFFLCNGPVHVVEVSVESSTVHGLAEITLVLLLFADAARVNPRDLRHSAGLPARLLVIGLPLTFALGFGLASALFTDLPWEMAALLGAVLAPTDAALSAAVVTDPSLPEGIRRSLNVESGLNDGIATPVVTMLIASAATIIGVGAVADTASSPGVAALADVFGGLAIGVGIGYLGGQVVRWTGARGWIAPGGRRTAVLMLPVLAFLASREVGVNFFVAAFVAGLAFRTAMGKDDEAAVELPELVGRMLSLAVWFVFGAALLVEGLELLEWQVGIYALLSLTLVRMLPVALSMVGTGSGRPATLFIGWFGPRGLASVIFGLLIVEELPLEDPRVGTVSSAIVLTVLLSVIAHGVSGRPLAAWLGRQQGDGGLPAGAASIRARPTFGLRRGSP